MSPVGYSNFHSTKLSLLNTNSELERLRRADDSENGKRVYIRAR
jgi:hypothetical protein